MTSEEGLKIHVMIVDDSPADRRALRRVITKLGNEIKMVEVSGGEEGLDRLGRSSFDCVFVDLDMPGISGIAMIEQLRRGGNQTPVVMVTGTDSSETMLRAFQTGATDYLVKGRFTTDDIERCFSNVKRALRVAEMEDRLLKVVETSKSRRS